MNYGTSFNSVGRRSDGRGDHHDRNALLAVTVIEGSKVVFATGMRAVSATTVHQAVDQILNEQRRQNKRNIYRFMPSY